MTDIRGRDPMRLIERQLKRKDDGHVIDDPTIGLDATLPPGPNLRTDIKEHLDAQGLCRLGQPKIEFLVIDADEKIRALIPREFAHAIEGTTNLAIVSCDLGKANDPNPTGVEANVDTGFSHRGSTHADAANGRNDRLEFTKQARCMLVPRGLPGGQHDQRGAISHSAPS